MSPYRDSRWTKVILIIFFLIIIGYAYFELRGLLFGPTLTISSDVTTSHEQFILVAGKAERIVSLAMNGKEITVTEDGNFSEPYLLAPGLNRIAFDAKDTYGHVTSRTVEIMYVPSQKTVPVASVPAETLSTSSPPVATTTQMLTPRPPKAKSTTTSKTVERH